MLGRSYVALPQLDQHERLVTRAGRPKLVFRAAARSVFVENLKDETA
ncbi:hypothetical protein ACIQU3_13185 [Streptomyces sp. NPDC101110]